MVQQTNLTKASGAGSTVTPLPNGIGTFGPGITDKSAQVIESARPTIGGATKKIDGIRLGETKVSSNIENYGVSWLVSKLVEEAAKIGNLEDSRVTHDDKNKIWDALSTLNPSKYPAREVPVSVDVSASPVIEITNAPSPIIKNSVLRAGKQGASLRSVVPSITEVAHIKPQEAAPAVEATVEDTPLVAPRVDLFEQLHSSQSTSTPIVTEPIPEETKIQSNELIEVVPPMEVSATSQNPEKKSALEAKNKAVGDLFNVLLKYRSDNWMNYAVAISLGIPKQGDPHENQRLPSQLDLRPTEDWRQSENLKLVPGLEEFLKDMK